MPPESAPEPPVAGSPAPPTEVLPPVADPTPEPTEAVTPVAEPEPRLRRPRPPRRASGFAPVTAAAAAASGTVKAGPVPTSERTPSPFDVFEPENRRRRWPRRLLIVGGIVLVLCAGYVVASFAVADTVPRGATVSGVDIGGLKSAEAVTRLETELSDDTTQADPGGRRGHPGHARSRRPRV